MPITVPLTGNVYIDGLLYGGRRLSSNRVTYSFWSDESLDDARGDIDRNDTAWLNYEVRAMRLGLEAWSNVANINFVNTRSNNPNANFGFLLLNNSERSSNILGSFGIPVVSDELVGYFNTRANSWNPSGVRPGGLGFVTIIHEIGHGLGLAHPHDNDSGSRLFPGVFSQNDRGTHGLNQGVWTTMTYNDGLNGRGYQSTPMALDIAAIQRLYGANMSHNTGGNTYSLPTRNGPGTSYFSIWDAGGYDTISARNATDSAVINLNSAPLSGPNAGGYLSSVSQVDGGSTIANGVVIERAIGGFSHDRLIGNSASNVIVGNEGNDVLTGHGGNDVLSGGTGNDLLIGHQGNDILNGGSGHNRLHSGVGYDVFYFSVLDRAIDTILDFNPAADYIDVNARAFGFGSQRGILATQYFRLGARALDSNDRFIYNRQSGILFFDADGVGGAGQIGLARLANRALLRHSDFRLV